MLFNSTMFANTLKTWTGKGACSIVFDSDVDRFIEASLFEHIRGRPNIAIIASTSDGDVFGGYYTVAVTEIWETFRDPNIFIFSSESRGRCYTPQRFALKPGKRKRSAYVKFFWHSYDQWYVEFGAGGTDGLSLGDERSFTWCNNLAKCFVGIENTTLTGRNGKNYPHVCERILAVQFW